MIWCQRKSGSLVAIGFFFLLSAYMINAHPMIPTVYSNSQECSNIGLSKISDGGSAVDAAISTILCVSLASLQGFAIGGGFVMKLWDSQALKGSILTAKEQPPANVKTGAKAIHVPGDVAGFWEVHQKYGRLNWKSLFENAINTTTTNSVEDNAIISPKLVETLKKIQEHGSDVFYNGEIAKELVKEIEAAGGSTTLDDFKNYKPQWQEDIKIPTKVEFKEKNELNMPHASVVGSDGFCVTVTSTNSQIPTAAFKSESTGVILKEG